MTEPPSSSDALVMPEPIPQPGGGGPGWYDLGPVEALAGRPLREVRIGRVRLALTYRDGVFGAISGVCNHVGGPLGEGTLDGDYVVCPWHDWKFHCTTGAGEPGFEEDRVPELPTSRCATGASASTSTPATQARPAAARAASARARARARAGAAARGRHLDHGDGHRDTRATRPPTRCSRSALEHAGARSAARRG